MPPPALEVSWGIIEEHPKEETQSNALITIKKEQNKTSGLLSDAEKKSKSSGLLNADSDSTACKKNPSVIKNFLKNFIAEKHTIELKSSNIFPYAEIKDSHGNIVSIYLDGSAFSADTKTFSGQPIHIGILISTEGHLKEVIPLSYLETESFMKRIERAGYYSQYQKLSLFDNDHRIDAVTGATISSKAISNTVSKMINQSNKEILPQYFENTTGEYRIRAELNRMQYVFMGFVFLFFFLFWISEKRMTRKIFFILSLVSIVYIGFTLNSSFSYVIFLQFFLGTPISLLFALFAFFIVIGAVWNRNTYCRRICPYGNIQRLMMKISPFKNSLRLFPPKISKYFRNGLALILTAGIILDFSCLLDYEPYPEFFGLFTSSPWFWISIGLLLLSLLMPRPWCRNLCPTGAVLDFLTKISRSKSQITGVN